MGGITKTAAFLLASISAAITPLGAQTIESTSSDSLTLSVGSSEGVQVGMSGRITKQEMVGGQLQTFEIARFRVTQVEPSSCTATLTEVGSGWSVEPGMEVVFDQPLVAPKPTARATPRLPTPIPTPKLPSDPAALDRLATEAFEAGQWERSIELDQALLEVVPNEPLAKKRLREAEQRLEAERRAADEASRRAAEEARRREEVEAKLANADYLMDRGDQSIEAKEWELAAEYYGQVAEVDPSFRDAGARQLLAKCHMALAANDHTEARRTYDRLKVLALPRDLAAQVKQLTELTSLTPGAEWVDPGIGMRFRYVPAGTFEMGSPAGEADRVADERQHQVTLTRGYWMGETEVTQGQWRAVAGTNPSYFSSCGNECPVEQVSWFDAVVFANAMSRKAEFEECYRVSGDSVTFIGLGCRGFRLPTEAEWEHAARAGSNYRYSGGDDLDAVGWYDGNSNSRTHMAAQKQANGWGLHDMSGNVWEWCWDRYGDYPSGAVTDPIGPVGGPDRVGRSCAWASPVAGVCRPACRSWFPPGHQFPVVGLRLVKTDQGDSDPAPP